MSKSALAITEEHTDLADSVIGQLNRLNSRAAARATLEKGSAHPSEIWSAGKDLGWNGLAIAEEYGGSGFGLAELAVVLEVQGRELSPGPFLPTVAAAVVIDRCAPDSVRAQLLPGLADGSTVGALALSGNVTVGSDLVVTGESPAVLGAPDADVLVIAAGEDVILVDANADGVTITPLDSLDTTRSVGSVALRAVTVDQDRVLARRRTQGTDGVPDPGVGRSGWRQLGGAGHGRRIRQGARAVRQDHRHLPGRQAPRRQHVRQCRGDHRGGLGRGPRRRSGQRVVPRRGRGRPRDPHSGLQRAEQHSAARRHRRTPGSTTPTCTCGGPAHWRR